MTVWATLLAVIVVATLASNAQGCFVECPLGTQCRSYYDFRSGCSICACRGQAPQEVCPNRMICPRNCPIVVKSPGCYTCSCAFLHRYPFHSFSSPR